MFPRFRSLIVRKTNGIPIAVFVLLVAATELFVDNEIKNLETEKRLDTIAFVQTLQSRVDRELNAILFISQGLSSYIKVYHRDLDPVRLKAILADLYAKSRHVRNMGIAVGYKMAYVHPVQGNEKALQLDYRKVPEQMAKVKQAIDARAGVLDGPMTLYQGGEALIYRYPVFADDRFWGIISTVINTSSFLNAAFSGVSDNDYAFAIRKIQETGEPGKVFYGDHSLFNNPDALVVTNEVPNGMWQWAVLNNTKNRIASTTLILRGVGWLLSLVLALTVLMLLRERRQLAKDALHDELTGLANRRLLMDRIEQHLLGLERNKAQDCSVLLLDLNGFKKINDTHGHHAGDAVLKAVAERIVKEVRSEDTVARLGGDEYVIVLNHEKDSDFLDALKERIRVAIKSPIEFNGHALTVGASIGTATCPCDGTTAEQLIRAADGNMYAEKNRRAQAKAELEVA